MMPLWVQYVLGAAALLAALGVIWSKLIKPLAKMITTTEKMLPLLQELTKTFGDHPNAFLFLHDIWLQFKTDGGSSLRDVINRLEAAAEANRMAGEVLKVGVEAQKELAKLDREQLQRLIILLDRLSVKVDAGSATADRIERNAEEVRIDLAESHRRADQTSGEAGAAADAAAQLTVREMVEGAQ